MRYGLRALPQRKARKSLPKQSESPPFQHPSDGQKLPSKLLMRVVAHCIRASFQDPSQAYVQTVDALMRVSHLVRAMSARLTHHYYALIQVHLRDVQDKPVEHTEECLIYWEAFGEQPLCTLWSPSSVVHTGSCGLREKKVAQATKLFDRFEWARWVFLHSQVRVEDDRVPQVKGVEMAVSRRIHDAVSSVSEVDHAVVISAEGSDLFDDSASLRSLFEDEDAD